MTCALDSCRLAVRPLVPETFQSQTQTQTQTHGQCFAQFSSVQFCSVRYLVFASSVDCRGEVRFTRHLAFARPPLQLQLQFAGRCSLFASQFSLFVVRLSALGSLSLSLSLVASLFTVRGRLSSLRFASQSVRYGTVQFSSVHHPPP